MVMSQSSVVLLGCRYRNLSGGQPLCRVIAAHRHCVQRLAPSTISIARERGIVATRGLIRQSVSANGVKSDRESAAFDDADAATMVANHLRLEACKAVEDLLTRAQCPADEISTIMETLADCSVDSKDIAILRSAVKKLTRYLGVRQLHAGQDAMRTQLGAPGSDAMFRHPGIGLAHRSVQEWWAQLADASVGPEPADNPCGTFLRLKEPCVFPNTNVNVILRRQCYVDMTKAIMMEVRQGTTDLLLTGTSGVGKSMYLHYLLFQLRTKGVTVLYQTHLRPSRMWLLLPDGSSYEGPAEAFEEQLEDSKVWYICNSVKPQQPQGMREAITLLISSSTVNLHEFLKQYPGILWLDVWEREELYAAWSVCFRDRVDEDQWQRRYQQFGGVARSILQNANYDNEELLLTSTISKFSLDDIRKAINREVAPAVDISQIIHCRADRQCKLLRYVYATDFIAQQVMKMASLFAPMELELFVRGSAGDPQLSSLCPPLWECHGHKVIMGGGTFEVRALEQDCGAVHKLEIQRSTQPFKDLSRNMCRPGVYLQPVSSNLSGVDGPTLHDNASGPMVARLWQFTVSSQPPIATTELRQIVLSFFPEDVTVEGIYFGVPPKVFKSFKRQPGKQSSSNSAARAEDAAGDVQISKIPQYVVKIGMPIFVRDALGYDMQPAVELLDGSEEEEVFESDVSDDDEDSVVNGVVGDNDARIDNNLG